MDTSEIDTTLVTAWLAAMLSGDYEKATGALRRPNGNMCAEGVLADQAVKERAYFWRPKGLGPNETAYGVVNDPHMTKAPSTHVPPCLAREAGLHVAITKTQAQSVSPGVPISYTRTNALGDGVVHVGAAVRQMNDKAAGVPLPSLAEHIHALYTDVLGVTLPPLSELQALSEDDTCVRTPSRERSTGGAEVPA